MNLLPARLAALALLCAFANSLPAAPETQRQYLSGRSKDAPVPWRFLCTSGARSGVWTNLPVPSHWDMHGFGTLTYKKDATNAWNERGLYEYGFNVPANWSGHRVFLVFEGVMTDTSAKLNGQSVGPTHQGGFYRFKYEVTSLVKSGGTNLLTVEVARHSANDSVNRAERLADYWVFAGIYRPVYLEAVPPQFIERVAIDAKADGAFAMEVFMNGAGEDDTIEAQVLTLDGKPVGDAFGVPALAGPSRLKAELRTQIASPRQWTAETPNLYLVETRLKRGDQVLHRVQERFGFRTMEVREGDGLYVNGRKVILQGTCRHSFWPESGRCLSEAVHRLDIEAMKDANMNAVRMSHYPPDVEFLDLCDELGLYVLDELGGWQKFYDTDIGTRLVEETVTRDVNHPSILFWDNGNEGGFNTNLDAIFPKFDLQARRVLHPWAPFSGVNTAHYLAYDTARDACAGLPMHWQNGREVANPNDPRRYIYLPTEFLHGLFDGGMGAGMEDYWTMMMRSPLCAGGFVWVFSDETVKRPDTGEMDSAGNQAPDGFVGPYRQREGSFYTIKELWSPIQVARATNGAFMIENRYSFTDASQCKFTWQLRQCVWPFAPWLTNRVLAQGVLAVPAIPPGGKATVPSPLPANTSEADLVSLRVDDLGGRELWTWTWPLPRLEALRQNTNIASQQARFLGETGDAIRMAFQDLAVNISKQTGFLEQVERGGKKFSLSGGPRPAVGSAQLVRIETNATGGDVAVLASFSGDLSKVKWTLRSDGWLQCDYKYSQSGTNDFSGVLFDFPERAVKRKRWLGDGPFRVWKNRLRGVSLGVWENDYNNTLTGHRDWVYPEFKGFFANVRWLELDTTEGRITAVVQREIPFVQVLTPEFPPNDLVGQALVRVPQAGLGFLHAIPPIGSKFKPASSTGPQGQPYVLGGTYSGSVSFRFGE
jgi:hypothetical protein